MSTPETDTTKPSTTYITTPIYYVNDRPHIGHCYTTLVADVLARFHRLLGNDVFFLTGTDEHAEKVVTSAKAHDMTAQQWADHNAARFREAFQFMQFSNDDFVRTSEDRHKLRASAYIQRLVDQGDIELGDYEGWWDASQEEYVPENTAREHDYKSPVTKKPLEKRVEQNYFFRLDKYEDWLRAMIEEKRIEVLPEQRKNEVLGRIKQGLQKVPVSRKIKDGDEDWGIRMPNDPDHRVYVWIEALCNYLTVVDNAHPACDTSKAEGDRRTYWPKSGQGASNVVHFMAKDILWFHAVIWPAMLHALSETPPTTVYAHAYWVAEGVKMSKSLGNFIELDDLKAYADRYSLDAVRWYLITQGPLGATDADFAYKRFVEVYNADLANGIGNCASRVGNMIAKYFDGKIQDWQILEHFNIEVDGETVLRTPPRGRAVPLAQSISNLINENKIGDLLLSAKSAIRIIDQFLSDTAPFKLAKDPSKLQEVHSILYQAAESIRIVSLAYFPTMPEKMAQLWRNWNCTHLNDPNDIESGFVAPLMELAQWAGPYGLKPGQQISKGDALFMRADVNAESPAATKPD
ncbi:MAG: methionine--tRNA ligase [Phycisphaeraceae bacterium]|nr:methionine--tRNA ligase [Phycisphaerales bacterium]MCB9860104.1 methionine--tRNA ligase [Phycisphaeraceae bacterium]